MSDHTQTADIEPIPIQQRRWFRETLKLVAAAIVFITIGAVLALTLRGNDDQAPAVAPSGPTPTPTVESIATPTPTAPMATATVAAVVPPPATSTPPPATATATVEPPPADVQATITVGRYAGPSVAGAGAIWVPDFDRGDILRIDPATNQVVTRIEAHARVIAFDSSLWAIDESGPEASLLQIDPATNAVVATIPLPGVASGTSRGMAAGAGSIWISVPDPASDLAVPSVVRVDPVAQTIVATITGIGPLGIVATDDAVWVADFFQSNNAIARIDPATNTIVARIAVQAGPTTVVVGAGSVWVTNQDSGSVSRIDPATNEVVATIYMGSFQVTPEEHPVGIAVDEHGVWVTDLDKPQLYQIDPATNEVVSTFKTSASPGIVASEGSLWLTTFRSNTVLRINPAP
jgi:YVTN family beta-propeller protein